MHIDFKLCPWCKVTYTDTHSCAYKRYGVSRDEVDRFVQASRDVKKAGEEVIKVCDEILGAQ